MLLFHDVQQGIICPASGVDLLRQGKLWKVRSHKKQARAPFPTSKNAKQTDSLLFIGLSHNSTVTMPQSYLSQLDSNIYLLEQLAYHDQVRAVLGMSLTNLTSLSSLGSNLASVTDLKRIQAPHNLCCDFGGYKTLTTCWSGGRVQV